MATIKLTLWQNPNFPSSNILENQTEAVLKCFNRCRIIDIKLRVNDNKIKNLHKLFNSLTEKRAIESLRLSMFAGDVVIYMKLLSEESTSIGVILETLSSLLDTAQERKKITEELKDSYKEFLIKFDKGTSDVQINLTYGSTSREIIVRDQNDAPIEKSWVLKVIGIAFPIFVGLVSGLAAYWNFEKITNLNLTNYLFYCLIKSSSQHNSNYVKETQNDDSSNNESGNSGNDNKNDNIEHHPNVPEPFSGLRIKDGPVFLSSNEILKNLKDLKNLLPSLNSLRDRFRGMFYEESDSDTKIVDKKTSITEDLPTPQSTSPVDVTDRKTLTPTPQPTSPADNDNKALISSTSITKDLPTIGNSRTNTENSSSMQSMSPTSTTVNNETGTENSVITDSATLNNTLSVLPQTWDYKNLLFSCAFGIILGYITFKFLRKKKPILYRWLKKCFTRNKNHNPRSQNVSDEQQLIIEKNNKILAIKEKLPVIIKNVEILDQFWDNQIININDHIKTLKSVSENEEIRIPQEIAAPIREDWDKQAKECKMNHSRTKDLVTRNSLLSMNE